MRGWRSPARRDGIVRVLSLLSTKDTFIGPLTDHALWFARSWRTVLGLRQVEGTEEKGGGKTCGYGEGEETAPNTSVEEFVGSRQPDGRDFLLLVLLGESASLARRCI